MSIDTPPIPPEGEPRKKNNNLLWGCVIALVLFLVIICCGGTLVLMPLFSNLDPLGTGLRERIEEYIPLEYLEDPSSIPGFEELLDETGGLDAEGDYSETVSSDLDAARDIQLAVFYFTDFETSFSYPVGWDIEVEGYTVTFYHPESYTYIFMGEDTADPGVRAEEITMDIMDSIQEDAEEGSFNLISSADYYAPIGEDAHLTLFEWLDLEGYYTWAYDLEIVAGDSNIFIFLSGEDPDEIDLYGGLLDIIAQSLEYMTDLESGEDI